MKVNKLSKHKNTKKNTKRNNKTKKRINKTNKCINRLKGGDDNENKKRLVDFIFSLSKNTYSKKEKMSTTYSKKEKMSTIIFNYFDIKIILLYIVAYKLLDKGNLQQIFIWFSSNNSTNTENSYPFIMTLLKTDKINEQNRLLTLIYEKINLAIGNMLLILIYEKLKLIYKEIDLLSIAQFSSIHEIKFEFNNHLKYNEFNEHIEFIKYLNSKNYEEHIQTPLNMTKPIKNQDKKKVVMPKVNDLTTLLVGETNYLHFTLNYVQFFDEKGHINPYSCFVKNTELLINKSNISSSNA